MTVTLVAVIVVLVAVIGWLLRPGPRRRGGTLDLVPAAARGELDLDWSDPRSTISDTGAVEFYADPQTAGWLTVPLHGDAKSPVLLTTSPSG